MIELLGDINSAAIEIMKHDRFYEKLKKEDEEKIIAFAYENAAKALDFLVENSFELGSARKFISQYSEIVYDDSKDMAAYSDIRFPKNIITVYLYHIDHLMKELNLKSEYKDNLILCFLIHEFYHYLEHYANLGLKEYDISLFQWGPLKRSAKFQGLSEMSAMIFMRNVIGNFELFIKGENNE